MQMQWLGELHLWSSSWLSSWNRMLHLSHQAEWLSCLVSSSSCSSYSRVLKSILSSNVDGNVLWMYLQRELDDAYESAVCFTVRFLDGSFDNAFSGHWDTLIFYEQLGQPQDKAFLFFSLFAFSVLDLLLFVTSRRQKRTEIFVNQALFASAIT